MFRFFINMCVTTIFSSLANFFEALLINPNETRILLDASYLDRDGVDSELLLSKNSEYLE